MNTKIFDAIKKINPNAQFLIEDEDINSIQWLNGTTPIPLADIEAKMTELKDEHDAKQYQRDREVEYNKKSIGEQLDMIYWDKVNSTNLWSDWIAQIKTDNPKE